MKRPGLTSLTLAATLFVAAGAHAQQDAAILAAIQPKAETTTTTSAVQLSGATAEMQRSPDLTGDTYDAMLSLQTGKVAAEAAAKPAEPGAAFREKMLDMFDKNNDGQLDVTERMAARKFAEERGLGENGKLREDLVKRFDKNGNGRIDADEAAALRTFLQERQRRMAAAGAAVKPAMAVKPKVATAGAAAADMTASEPAMEAGAGESMAAATPPANRKAERKAERKMEKADSTKVVEELAKKREESLK